MNREKEIEYLKYLGLISPHLFPKAIVNSIVRFIEFEEKSMREEAAIALSVINDTLQATDEYLRKLRDAAHSNGFDEGYEAGYGQALKDLGLGGE